MKISQDVPAGQVMTVAGLRFVGPCRAEARVPDGSAVAWAETSPPPAPNDSQLLDTRARITLEQTDREMIRGLDDLIDLLAAKGVIAMGELPSALKQRLIDRAAAREDVIDES